MTHTHTREILAPMPTAVGGFLPSRAKISMVSAGARQASDGVFHMNVQHTKTSVAGPLPRMRVRGRAHRRRATLNTPPSYRKQKNVQPARTCTISHTEHSSKSGTKAARGQYFRCVKAFAAARHTFCRANGVGSEKLYSKVCKAVCMI